MKFIIYEIIFNGNKRWFNIFKSGKIMAVTNTQKYSNPEPQKLTNYYLYYEIILINLQRFFVWRIVKTRPISTIIKNWFNLTLLIAWKNPNPGRSEASNDFKIKIICLVALSYTLKRWKPQT